jgi:uncharacterized HAD superfamily protein
MKKKSVLGFDFDDVLMDFYSSFCDFHNQEYGTSLAKKDVYTFYIEDILKCNTDEAMKRVWDFYHSSIHDNADPIKDALETIKYLSQKHDLHIITARPDSVRKVTKLWLDKHFPETFKEIHFTNHFFGKEEKTTKAQICRRLGIEVFVDDVPHHAEDVANVAKQVLLFNAPWNEKHTILKTNIQRVNSWNDILVFFLDREKQ